VAWKRQHIYVCAKGFAGYSAEDHFYGSFRRLAWTIMRMFNFHLFVPAPNRRRKVPRLCLVAIGRAPSGLSTVDFCNGLYDVRYGKFRLYPAAHLLEEPSQRLATFSVRAPVNDGECEKEIPIVDARKERGQPRLIELAL
jgi:hypothetical protein